MEDYWVFKKTCNTTIKRLLGGTPEEIETVQEMGVCACVSVCMCVKGDKMALNVL